MAMHHNKDHGHIAAAARMHKWLWQWLCVSLGVVVLVNLRFLHANSATEPLHLQMLIGGCNGNLSKVLPWQLQELHDTTHIQQGLQNGTQNGTHVLVVQNGTEVQVQNDTQAQDIRVFVGVLSRGSSKEARQAVRDTWGADKRLARVMFFILRPPSNETFVAVRKEAAEKGDIITISEVQEDYFKITHATLELFRSAAVMGEQVTHVLKTDDDCYVRVSKLLEELGKLPRDRLLAGFPSWHSGFERRPGKPGYVPYSNWPVDKSVRYGFGWGYALSIDLVRYIAAGAPHMVMAPDNLLMIEDNAAAYWVDYIAQEQNITINYGGYFWDRKHMCQNHTVVAHLTQKWQLMHCMQQNNGLCCD